MSERIRVLSSQPRGGLGADSRPGSIEITTSERLILVKISGKPPQASVVTLIDDLAAIAAREGSVGVLIDETELDPSFIGPGDMDRFVGAWRQGAVLRLIRLAVVVSDPAIFGLNRQFEALSQGHGQVGVFMDGAEARAWVMGSSA